MLDMRASLARSCLNPDILSETGSQGQRNTELCDPGVKQEQELEFKKLLIKFIIFFFKIFENV